MNKDQWLKVMLLVGLLLMLISITKKGIMPGVEEIDGSLFQDPVQTRVKARPFRAVVDGNTYIIQPLYDYELRGLVVSYHNSNVWWDIYHHGLWQDFINVKDLCVVWGDNLTPEVYDDMVFNSDNWTCFATPVDEKSMARFRLEQLSNNHLLSISDDIPDVIMDVEKGDQIHLRGKLVNYANPVTRTSRSSSISRTDKGNGACETIFVEQFEVIRENNPGWRTAYLWSKIIIIGSVVLLVLNFMFGDVTEVLEKR